MQDKYVGDIGDFGKYGLLRTLAGIEPEAEPRYRLGIVWYLRLDAKLQYLSEPGGLCHYDNKLFSALLDIVSRQTRTVKEIEHSEIVPKGTVFFAEQVPGRHKRGEWLSRALEETEETEIAFLDPDNGLATSKMEAEGGRSQKHAYLDEVSPFVKRGQTVVIYQSYRRGDGDSRETEVRRWRDERLRELDLDERPRVVGTTDRAFIVLPATRHAKHIDNRLRGIGDRWSSHFKYRAL